MDAKTITYIPVTWAHHVITGDNANLIGAQGTTVKSSNSNLFESR